ncbi:hypothetical protein D1BOALGB6SA_10632 [Olavius sp. associated proteobacterium Delta 1]|nr:hypothetical protein D1BOALGB6SA_10632 [Olavius sp. associated proteobacterium Delta 1]
MQARKGLGRQVSSTVKCDTMSHFIYVITVGYEAGNHSAVPAGILGRRATVAQMTGCEALLTMYRIGRRP